MRLAGAGVQSRDAVTQAAGGILECAQQRPRHALPPCGGHHVHAFYLTSTVREPLDSPAAHRLAVAVTDQERAAGQGQFSRTCRGHVRGIEVQSAVELAHLLDHRRHERGAVTVGRGHVPKVQFGSHDSTSTGSALARVHIAAPSTMHSCRRACWPSSPPSSPPSPSSPGALRSHRTRARHCRTPPRC